LSSDIMPFMAWESYPWCFYNDQDELDWERMAECSDMCSRFDKELVYYLMSEVKDEVMLKQLAALGCFGPGFYVKRGCSKPEWPMELRKTLPEKLQQQQVALKSLKSDVFSMPNAQIHAEVLPLVTP